MKKPQKMEDDQFYKELPIWMHRMIQYMDGSSNEVLSTTTTRKAGIGQKGGRHSPLEGEWTHLVGEDTHA
jgi:hypothetical protein